jgi:hypothetical protein
MRNIVDDHWSRRIDEKLFYFINRYAVFLALLQVAVIPYNFFNDLLSEFRVLYLTVPRQAGKTTLAKLIAQQRDMRYHFHCLQKARPECLLWQEYSEQQAVVACAWHVLFNQYSLRH